MLFPTCTLNDRDIIYDNEELKVTKNKPNKKTHEIFIEKLQNLIKWHLKTDIIEIYPSTEIGRHTIIKALIFLQIDP